MDTAAAHRLYETNKKRIADKIEILNLALVALEDAIKEASNNYALAGTAINLEQFRDRQAHIIFDRVMDLDSSQIKEIS